jgi:ParB family chromosome partitioning protein
LIPTDVLDETFDPTAQNDEKISELRYLKHSDITPDPEQPRRHFDEEALAELAASIKEHGILQPLVVTSAKNGTYQIVAGERRWRASAIAGLEKIPAIVRTLSGQHKLELALIENLQRRDLNALETATAYLKLHQQFNLTYEEIGHRIGGKAVSTISNILRLLQLPDTAKQALVEGLISEGHARQILALDDPKQQQKFLEHIIAEGWSVRRAEQYVSALKAGTKPKATTPASEEPAFVGRLKTRLNLPVRIRSSARGGQLTISFKDQAELDRLEKLLS